jgi:hypothetical protein
MQIGGLIKCRDQQHWVKTDHRIAARSIPAAERSARLRRKTA